MAYCNRDCNMMMMMMKWPYHRNIIIVNFVKNEKCGRVDVFLHVYKSPYSNCCQMGFFFSQNTSKSMSAMASPWTPPGELTALS